MSNLKLSRINFTLNGQAVSISAPASLRLSDALRERLDCLDVKIGCNAGDCGACSVLLNGDVICSCLTALGQVEDGNVETLKGLVANDNSTQQLADAFLNHGAAQCGICTPGMLVSATSLLRSAQAINRSSVEDALGGVLCRCTGYRKIVDAVVDASVQSETVQRRGSDSNDATSLGGIGAGIRRLDGEPKVTGEDLFGDDVAPRDSLVLKVVRSPFHHARFEFGDLARYRESNTGIVRVFTAADIPGRNRFGVIPPFIDQPVFAEGTARFRGEAVAAVVGTAEAMASLALKDFPIAWTELPACLSVEEALSNDVALVHADRENNVMCRGLVKKGDAEAALASASVRASTQIRTGFVEHAYIEPEAGYAVRVGERVDVFGCTQAPFMDRDSLSLILDVAAEQVRIVPTSTGGGFGSKLDISFQPFVALAAWELNQPVRINYTRNESMQSTTKRHPANITFTAGVDSEGRLVGARFDGAFNTGAYASWGPTVANRVPVHASGPYNVQHYEAKTEAIHTHCVPSGAFRGFGVPQAAVAQETVFDDLALQLGVDRLQFRIDNALDNQVPTVTGQVFDTGVGIKACFDALQSVWTDRTEVVANLNANAEQSGSPVRFGIGVAAGWYGCGNTSLPNPSTIKAGITSSGKICLHQGAVDIGQGSNTVIAQIFATALGISVHEISLIGAATDTTPDAGKTSASRQTFVSGNAARLTGINLREQILRLTNCPESSTIVSQSGTLQVIPLNDEGAAQSIQLSELPELGGGYVLIAEETYDPPTEPLDEQGQGVPYALFGYAAQMVELSVDTNLGTVKLDKFYAAHDVGRAINPVLVEGQIQGGIAQGIGMALMESYIPGKTDNLHDYLIPTIGDVPDIESYLIEDTDPHGPYGAKGLGEHVLIPTAPAILNAIRHATGAVVTDLPATPDKVLAAVKLANNS